jgi:hypothetical protein
LPHCRFAAFPRFTQRRRERKGDYNNRAALGCNDTDRSVAALSGIVGKRITYRRDHVAVI